MPLRRGATRTGKPPPDGNDQADAVMVEAPWVFRNLSGVSKSDIIGRDKDARYPDNAGYRAELRICDRQTRYLSIIVIRRGAVPSGLLFTLAE